MRLSDTTVGQSQRLEHGTHHEYIRQNARRRFQAGEVRWDLALVPTSGRAEFRGPAPASRVCQAALGRSTETAAAAPPFRWRCYGRPLVANLRSAASIHPSFSPFHPTPVRLFRPSDTKLELELVHFFPTIPLFLYFTT